ncbi:hypothetical protein H6A32_15630 [Drancourtella massiliensis]|uniref:ImmA/IrrE family metallo-endopeptidase n=1 Tax=Drancourtella massiliensis TaxID=1632013 RepID=A0ABS2EKR9_9FIRM|nr:hypothetical protein [Drancourtella massiliensis]MBM6745685.1 hypothetical protein [Drancourtella massiliensis]
MKLQMNPAIMKFASRPQLALLILQEFGLIQMPIEDKFWSGAIFVKNGKIIPVLNTALPSANQYFTAWHEIYHLIFDKVSFDHFIERDNTMEERKAECFAASMLLTGVDRYFIELPEMDFVSKIFHCMSAFQDPYKAVLVSLYEYALQSENETLKKRVKEVFDLEVENMPQKFRKLGLDDSLVKPSYVINASSFLGVHSCSPSLFRRYLSQVVFNMKLSVLSSMSGFHLEVAPPIVSPFPSVLSHRVL